MLIRFNVANFLSFNEETEFNMLAAKSLRTHKGHVYPVKKGLDVLKASAIYGANGAGKSNLVKAINALKQIVDKGNVSSNVARKKFRLKQENEMKPISLEIEFSTKGKIYTYGISFDSGIVQNEWLYETGGDKGKIIFERTYSKTKKHPAIKVADKYKKTDKAKMLIALMEENLLKNNELFVSKNDNLKFEEIADLLNWVKNNLLIIYPETTPKGFTAMVCNNEKYKFFSENLLKTFNVGIENIEIQSESLESFLSKGYQIDMDLQELNKKLDSGAVAEFKFEDDVTIVIIKETNEYLVKKIVTTHKAINKTASFEIDEESDGTRRLIDFIPLVSDLLDEENTFIIDEIDRSLHPAILHTLIKKIMGDDTTKGQLVFTTHESSLLDCKIFRTDEIWFTEKNKDTQSTELYTLNEFKPRPDLDIEKGYLNGRFGAIPFLSKLEDLNWHQS